MAILTFRGHRYEPRVGIASKPCQSLTYRRATYLARREEAIVNRDLCVPEGFIRSKRTAELIGLPLVPCSRKLLVYGVSITLNKAGLNFKKRIALNNLVTKHS